MAIVFVRTIIIFFAIIISLRIMGKRQLGELEPNELVVAVLIADLASHPLQDVGIPLLNGLIPVVTLLACELIFSGIMMHSIRMRVLLCGKPSTLISNGKIVEREMRKNRFTLDELTEELRSQSVTDISKVKYAILETDGKLSLILYPAEQPVTPAQMNLAVDDPGYPSIVINDGRVLQENLRIMGRDMKWLEKEVTNRKIGSIKDVYLMTVNNAGQVFCSQKEGI